MMTTQQEREDAVCELIEARYRLLAYMESHLSADALASEEFKAHKAQLALAGAELVAAVKALHEP